MASTAKQGPGRVTEEGRTGDPVVQGRLVPPPARSRTTATRPRSTGARRSAPAGIGFLIIGLFLLGVLIVILNYAGVLPGGVNNIWLVGAIGSIFVGLLLATRYH